MHLKQGALLRRKRHDAPSGVQHRRENVVGFVVPARDQAQDPSSSSTSSASNLSAESWNQDRQTLPLAPDFLTTAELAVPLSPRSTPG